MKQEHLVPPKDLPYIWPQVASLINKGLPHTYGEIDAEVFFLPIYTGQQHLWVGIENDTIDMVLIAEVLPYQLKTSLFIHVWATKSGRDFEPWMECFDSIKNFAKINGCDYIEARVRKGLAKKLKWTDKHSIVTLEL